MPAPKQGAPQVEGYSHRLRGLWLAGLWGAAGERFHPCRRRGGGLQTSGISAGMRQDFSTHLLVNFLLECSKIVIRRNLRRGGGQKLSPVPASLVAGLLDGSGKFSSKETVFPFVLAKGEASMGGGLYSSGSSKGREEPPVLIRIRLNMGTTSSHQFRHWL